MPLAIAHGVIRSHIRHDTMGWFLSKHLIGQMESVHSVLVMLVMNSSTNMATTHELFIPPRGPWPCKSSSSQVELLPSPPRFSHMPVSSPPSVLILSPSRSKGSTPLHGSLIDLWRRRKDARGRLALLCSRRCCALCPRGRHLRRRRCRLRFARGGGAFFFWKERRGLILRVERWGLIPR